MKDPSCTPVPPATTCTPTGGWAFYFDDSGTVVVELCVVEVAMGIDEVQSDLGQGRRVIASTDEFADG